ncbi:MAG: hypothetical protein KAH44_27360 [Oricola sp.]|nr:hypothetical protein [Oricola sp.]
MISLTRLYGIDLLSFLFLLLLLAIEPSDASRSPENDTKTAMYQERNPSGLFVEALALKLREKKYAVCVESYGMSELTKETKEAFASCGTDEPEEVLRIDVREGVVRLPSLFCETEEDFAAKGHKCQGVIESPAEFITRFRSDLFSLLNDIEAPYAKDADRFTPVTQCLGEPTLAEKATLAEGCPYRLIMIVVEGHADQHDDPRNEAYSLNRANTLRDQLVRQETKLKITSAGYGCTRPIFYTGPNPKKKLDMDCTDLLTSAISGETDPEQINRNRRIDLRFVFRATAAGASS